MAQGRNSRLITSALAGVAAAALVAASASAQPAPIGGHHAARGADSGYGAGQVSPTGGYRAAIPVDAPGARGGIPVPFAVAYNGGSVVGEAGVGWAVPFSYIAVSKGVVRRRPTYYVANSEPIVRERVTLSMGGGAMVMLPAGDGSYQAAVNAPTLRLRKQDGAWILRNGGGLVFRFERLADLGDDNLWLLREINDPSGNNPVQLGYEITDVKVGDDIHKELSLSDVAYNEHPDSPNCFKHKIHLRYHDSYDGRDVLAYQAVGGQMRVRKRIINYIEVMARGSGCGSYSHLRSYQLKYADDKDTGQPRLVEVNASGRVDPKYATEWLPVGRYEYGGVTRDDGTIKFAPAGTMDRPNAFQSGAEGVSRSRWTKSGTTTQYSTQQMVHDLTGDGLPDFIYGSVTAAGGTFKIAPSKPSGTPNLPPSFGVATDLLPGFSDVLLGHQRRHRVTSDDPLYNLMTQDDTYSQFIDFNADGRTDIVVSELNGDWTLYLNTPGTSGGIQWKPVTLNMSMVRTTLASYGLLFNGSSPLPLSRTRSGLNQNMHFCWQGTSGNTWLPCDTNPEFNPPQTRQWHALTEWTLRDVNGDGYPDLVSNRMPVGLHERKYHNGTVTDDSNEDANRDVNGDGLTDPYCRGTQYQPDPTWDATEHTETPLHCYITNYVGFPEEHHNQLMVFYNRAGTHLGTSSSPFTTARVLSDSSGAVAEWHSTIPIYPWIRETDEDHPVYGSKNWLAFGLMDVNGDGMADRIESDGDYRAVARARLGTGEGFNGSISLPGTVGYSENTSEAHCGDGTPSDSLDDVEAGHYYTRKLSALVDVNGDGLPDYVTPKHVQLGTGTGWAPAAVADIHVQYSLSRTDELCESAPIALSAVQGGMFDMDGDGRTDVVHAEGGTLRVYRVANRAGEPGAFDAGRLIRVRNGYGGVTDIRYTSAKHDTKSSHQVPYSEIVVDEVQAGTADGSVTLEPTRFAYGDARMRYDAFADRWVFDGYAKRVAMRGLPEGGAAGKLRLTGVATVHYMVTPATGFAGHAQAGRKARTDVLDGIFTVNPYDLFDLDLSGDARRHGSSSVTYHTHEQLLGGAQSFDCTDHDPYNTTGVYIGDTIDDDCGKVGFARVETSTSWRGTAGPSSLTPDKNVRTLTNVEADGLGRPTMIHHFNDLYVNGDDLCEDVTYASGSDNILSAVHTRRFRACDKTGAGGNIVAGVRFRYDDLPEGQVTLGRPTHRIVERYNVSTGVKLDDYVASVTSYDARGNVTQVTSENQTPQVQNGVVSDPPAMVTVSQTQRFSDFDPFGLVPRTQRVSASSADASVNHVDVTTSVVLDPYTLETRSATDANGTTWLTYRDEFGRPIRRSVQGAGEPTEYVVSTTEYHGFSTTATGLPWVRSVRYHSDLTSGEFDAGDSASASQTVSTTYLDALGRVSRSETSLGADYGNATLVSAGIQYDGLGRVVFAPDPYVSTDTSSTRYGTSTLYRADGSTRCSIRGRGLQLMPSSDETTARYATCVERLYENNRLVVRVRGANELLNGSGQEGAYSESVQTAIGWVLEKSRWHGGIVERSTHKHDRLGNLFELTRYEDPAAQTGAVVWQSQYDSLGQRLRLVEPAASPRTNYYDRWGNLYESRSGSGSTARRVVSEVDGLGRVVRNIEAKGTSADLDSYTELHYDTASGDANHIGAANLIGRLSWTSSKGRKTYFGYDGFGRRNSETRAEGSERFTTQFDYAVSGHLRAMSFSLPDNDYAPETVLYSYDSAMRMVGVAFDDGGGAANMLTVNEMDPFGRPLRQTYGNGVVRQNVYKEEDRKELQYTNLGGPNGWTLYTGFSRYDARLRLLQRDDYSNTKGIELSTTRYRYDSLYRLVETQKEKLGTIIARKSFGYDGLGNLRQVLDHSANTTRTIKPDSNDRDRVCEVETTDGLADPFAVGSVSETPFTATRTLTSSFGFGGIARPPSCPYKYDKAGNATVTVDDERSRSMTYDARNRIREMTSSGVVARYRYDALGDIAGLDIGGGGTDVDRTDRRFGAFIERQVVVESTGTRVEIKRSIPGPAGVLALRGPPGNANTVYLHGDGQANRAFTDDTGTVVQKVDYDAFGAIVGDTGTDNSSTYVKYLWNGGDALKAFGITHLGARLYDPKVGRFLQRDPLLIPRSSSMAHPYAFAHSDPVNKADPSGLDPCGADACISQTYSNDFWSMFLGGLASGFIGLATGPISDMLFGSRRGQQPANPGVVVAGARFRNYAEAEAALNNWGNQLMEVTGAAGHLLDIGKAAVWDIPVSTVKGLGNAALYAWNNPWQATKGILKTTAKMGLTPGVYLAQSAARGLRHGASVADGVLAGDAHATAEGIMLATGVAGAVRRSAGRFARRFSRLRRGGPRVMSEAELAEVRGGAITPPGAQSRPVIAPKRAADSSFGLNRLPRTVVDGSSVRAHGWDTIEAIRSGNLAGRGAHAVGPPNQGWTAVTVVPNAPSSPWRAVFRRRNGQLEIRMGDHSVYDGL